MNNELCARIVIESTRFFLGWQLSVLTIMYEEVLKHGPGLQRLLQIINHPDLSDTVRCHDFLELLSGDSGIPLKDIRETLTENAGRFVTIVDIDRDGRMLKCYPGEEDVEKLITHVLYVEKFVDPGNEFDGSYLVRAVRGDGNIEPKSMVGKLLSNHPIQNLDDFFSRFNIPEALVDIYFKELKEDMTCFTVSLSNEMILAIGLPVEENRKDNPPPVYVHPTPSGRLN